MITVTEWEKVGDSEHSYSATAETRNAAIKTLEALRDRDAELVNEVLGENEPLAETKQFTREDVEEFVKEVVRIHGGWLDFNGNREANSHAIDITADTDSEQTNVTMIHHALTARICQFLGIKEAE
jgi:hypothetical protein